MSCARPTSFVALAGATAVVLLGGSLALSARANAGPRFRIVYAFTGGKDGGAPGYTLLPDRRGGFFGTDGMGGRYGNGTVFWLQQISGGWQLRTVYDFTSNDGLPGWGLIHGPHGSLYTNASYAEVLGGPCGSALRLDRPAAAETPHRAAVLLHTYAYAADGCPTGNLLRGKSGHLFGATQDGGAYGWGSLFELSPRGSGWKETILYSFHGQTDGGAPYSELISDAAGNLYGTASASTINQGTVFELSHSSSGWSYKVLHTFFGGDDGGQPVASLRFDRAGDLFGATTSFGRRGGGTIFEMTPSGGGWRLDVLHSLSGSDGPVAKLSRDSTGTIYGTNFMDGADGYGSVFRLSPEGGKWRYRDLHDFTGGSDGGYPGGGVRFDDSGNLYGTAVIGGAHGYGVLYEITP